MQKFRRTKLLLGGLLVAAFVIGLWGPAHAIALSDQTLIELTNQARTANGLPKLAWNAELSNSARLKGQDMCDKDYWAHTAPDGTTGWTFMSQSGYAYTAAGENLAKDYSDDGAVLSAWMASEGHRANILNAAYQDIGIAHTSCTLQGVTGDLVVAHYGALAKRTETLASAPVKSPSAASHPPATPAPSPVTEPKTVADASQNFGDAIWSLSWRKDLPTWPFH